MKPRYPKKPCWSWHYRVKFDRLNSPQYRTLVKSCNLSFGSLFDYPHARWDITAVRRVNSLGFWWYSRVKVHFKHAEDLVFFSLSHNIAELNGEIS